MDENTGTRLGGLGELMAAASTSRTVSSDGWTANWRVVCQLLPLQKVSSYGRGAPEPCLYPGLCGDHGSGVLSCCKLVKQVADLAGR